jgi:exopolyphosphatase/guanosine-5'-triphosphate,3'-diphosphate pyrophosphatase
VGRVLEHTRLQHGTDEGGYHPSVNAIIDIGTNTMLLLIVDEAMKPIVDACRFARLGQGLDASGRLADDAIARGLEVCREYRAMLDTHGVAVPVVVGTQALREASNRDAFAVPAHDILRAPVEVITGVREAELAFASVVRTFPDLSRVVVVDVGGGSTEIVVGEGGTIARATSLPIGAVRLTERHLKNDPPSAEEARALFREIDIHVDTIDVPRGIPVVATAGTATTLAALALRLVKYDAEQVTGYRMSSMAIDAQLARLLTANLVARRAMRGMEAGRADVIAAGVAILSRLVGRMEAPELIVADRGVRWGIAYEHAS